MDYCRMSLTMVMSMESPHLPDEDDELQPSLAVVSVVMTVVGAMDVVVVATGRAVGSLPLMVS